jgi:serine phosphatase RsbU (regulator of sigma subunit)
MKKPTTALKVLIWTCLTLVLLGQFFKIQQWPGAGLLIIIGTLIFCLFYLPLYGLEKWKELKEKKSKLFLVLQLFIFLLFAFGFLFKIQRWPGGGLLILLTTKTMFFVILPFALYNLIKAGRTDLSRTHNLMTLIFFFSFFFSTLMTSNRGKINIDAVLQQGLNGEEALRASVSRNKQLYFTIKQANDAASIILQKTQRLKTLSDSAFQYLSNLKSHLIVNVDKISKTQADSISSIQIENKIDFDETTFLLIGADVQPRQDYFSAHHLKKAIENFKDSVLALIKDENKPIIKEGLNLNTENYEGENGEPVTWIEANFSHMPLLYVFNTLTNIQYEIKNAEYQALTDIINSENRELNTALFSKIADLNSKYDAIKKQEEIAKLKTENQKGMDLIQEKESELSSTRQTIVIFVLIVIVFTVMVFFVIRSNIQRKKINRVLAQQKDTIELQKSEVESQKHLVEEKQKEIIDSISYAKRLQDAILPPAEFLNTNIPDNFILYKPKDIVAGDFYWAEKLNDLFFIAAADSTGHGVPGAMVSVVCSNALNRSVKEFKLTDPGKILDKTRELVIETFEKSTSEVKDGMDVSLLCIDKKNKTISWSGANNPLWFITKRDDQTELVEVKADKQPIGKSDHAKPFTTHKIEYIEGSVFYLFTDGFADQFGGENGKKFKYKQLSELLLKYKETPLAHQKTVIDKVFENWKGSLEQVDDVCVIGIKI